MVGKMRVTCPDCHGEGSRLRDKEKSVSILLDVCELIVGARNVRETRWSRTRRG